MLNDVDRLVAQVSQHQAERRRWHDEALARDEENNRKHATKLTGLVLAVMIRPVIEIGILIVLIIKL